MQKVNNHKTALDVMAQKLGVLNWKANNVPFYNMKEYSCVKKILQAISDLYIIGVNPFIIYNNHTFETAMYDLQLTDVQIHPTDFAKEIMQHTGYLPLYIKDELNYNDPECEISDYGRIVCRAYEMTFDFQIQELALAYGKSMDEFCLPAIEKFVKEKDIATKSADKICKDLLDDVHKLRCKRQEALQSQAVPQVQAPKKRLLKKKEDKKMAIIAAPGIWEYTPRKFREKQLLQSNIKCFDQGHIQIINQGISVFDPDIVVISDGIDIHIPNPKAESLSLADFYCGYWIPKNNNGESEKYVAICEYHNNYQISLYYIPDTGKIAKEVFKLSWTTFTEDLQNKILHCNFFKTKNVDSHDIAVYRFFEDLKGDKSKKLDNIKSKRNDSKFVKYIDADWVRKLQDPIEQNQAVELLKNFKERLR